jgi:hypothetical protein
LACKVPQSAAAALCRKQMFLSEVGGIYLWTEESNGKIMGLS